MNLKPLSKSPVTNVNSISSILNVFPRITNSTLNNTVKKSHDVYFPDKHTKKNSSATPLNSNDLLNWAKCQHGYDFYNVFCSKTKSGSSLSGRKSSSTFKTAGKYRKFMCQYRYRNSNEKIIELLQKGFIQGKLPLALSTYYCEKTNNPNDENDSKPKTSKDDACQIKKDKIHQRNLDIYNIKTNIDGLGKTRIKIDDPCKPTKELKKRKSQPLQEIPYLSDKCHFSMHESYGSLHGEYLDPKGEALSKPIDICSQEYSGECFIEEYLVKCNPEKKVSCLNGEEPTIEERRLTPTSFGQKPTNPKTANKEDLCLTGENSLKNMKLASNVQDSSPSSQNGGDGSMKGGDGSSNGNAAWKKIKCKRMEYQCPPKKCGTTSNLPKPKICYDICKALKAINEMQKDPCKNQSKNKTPCKIVDGKIVCQIKNMCCVLEKYDPCNPNHKNVPEPKPGDKQFCCKIEDLFCICTKIDKKNGKYVASNADCKTSCKPKELNAPICEPIKCQSTDALSPHEDFIKRMGGICSAVKETPKPLEATSKDQQAHTLKDPCKTDAKALQKVKSKDQIKTTKEQIQDFCMGSLQKLKDCLPGSQDVCKSQVKTKNVIDPKAKKIEASPKVNDISIQSTKPKVLSNVESSNICAFKSKLVQSLDTGVSKDQLKVVASSIEKPCVLDDPCKSADNKPEPIVLQVENDISIQCKDGPKIEPCELKDPCKPADPTPKLDPCKPIEVMPKIDPCKPIEVMPKVDACKPLEAMPKLSIPELPKESSTLCVPQDPCKVKKAVKDIPCPPKLATKILPKPNILEDPCKEDIGNRSCMPEKKPPCIICGDKIVCEFEDRTCVCEIYNPCKQEHRDPPKLNPDDKKSICKIGDLHCECTKRCDLFTKVKASCEPTNVSCKPRLPVKNNLPNSQKNPLQIKNCKMIEGKMVLELKNTCCVCEKFNPCDPQHTNIAKPRSTDKISCCVIENMYCQCVKKSDVKIPAKPRDVNANCIGSNKDEKDALLQAIFDKVKLEIDARAARGGKGGKCPLNLPMSCSDETANNKAAKDIFAEICKKAKASCATKKSPCGPVANPNCDIDVKENMVKSNVKTCGKVKWPIPAQKKQDASCEQLSKAICESIEIASKAQSTSKNVCDAIITPSAKAKTQNVNDCKPRLKSKSVNDCEDIVKTGCEKPQKTQNDCSNILKTECVKTSVPQDSCAEDFKATKSETSQVDCVENVKDDCAKPDISKDICVEPKRQDMDCMPTRKQDDPCVKQPEQSVCESFLPKQTKKKQISATKINDACDSKQSKGLADSCISKITANKQEGNTTNTCAKASPPVNLYFEINKHKVDENRFIEKTKQPINIYVNVDLASKNGECGTSSGSKKRSRTSDPCIKSDSCKPQVKDASKAVSCKPKVSSPVIMADFCKKTKPTECPPKVNSCIPLEDACPKLVPPLSKPVDPCAKVDPCKPKVMELPTNDPCKKMSDTCSDTAKSETDKGNKSVLKCESKSTTQPTDKIKIDPCKRNASDSATSKNDSCKSNKDPSATKSDPCAAKASSSSKANSGTSGKSDSANDSCASKEDPCKAKSDPCAPKNDPCKQKVDPCAAKKDPCKAKIDPCAPKEDPCKAKVDPCPKNDPCKQKVDPCAAKKDPCKAKIDPCAPKEDPCKAKVDPCPKNDPCKQKVDPCAAKKDPCKSKIDPCAPKEDPCKAKVDPCAPKNDPCKQKVDPCAAKKDPCKAKIDPCAPKEDPSKAKVDPCAPKNDPCKQKVDPCAAKKDPCKAKIDPCAPKEDPCKAKVDPCPKNDPCKQKVDPCAAKKDPCKAKIDPCAPKEDPCKAKVDPCPKNDPCKQKVDPCAAKKDPCKSKIDPCAPKEDPCKAKVDPCAPKNDPCKQKVDPCAAKKDPCKAKIDPCAPKEDPCKAKVDPCPKNDPCKQKVDPCAAKKDPCKSKIDPCAPKEDPCKAKVDPCAPKNDPCKQKVDPCAAKKDPCKAKIDPCAPKEDPCKSKVDPCAPKNDPCKQKVDPCAAKKDPCKAKIDPCAPKEDPCKGKVDPCPKNDPCKQKVDPCAAKKDPCKSKIDPCAPKEDPCKAKVDPCAPKNDPCKQKVDPCAAKKDPCKAKIDPCAPKEDPCKAKVDPCPKNDPCKQKVDPCAAKKDPCKSKIDPCAPKEDPCKAKVDPCAPKNDPCKQKVDPCAAKKDPCKAKIDPCAPKEDPCKSKVDPCAPKNDPCKQKVDPCAAKKDPCKAKIDPCAPKEDPCKGKVDPCPKNDPCKQKVDPCAAKKDPCKSKIDPCAPKEDPCKAKVDPCAPKNDPCKQKVDPCAAKKDPCKAKIDPCAPKEDPCKSKVDPCAPKNDPCKQKVDPCAAKKDPCKAKIDPCAPKEDPCKAKSDPCAPKSDPKVDPCPTKIVPCTLKNDPCNQKVDPCASKSNPCKPKKPQPPCNKAKVKFDAKLKKRSQSLDSGTKKPDPCRAKVDPCDKDIVVYPPLEPEMKEPVHIGCKPRKNPCKSESEPEVDPCDRIYTPKVKAVDPSENMESLCAPKEPCKPKPTPKPKPKPCEPPKIDPDRITESLCTPLKPKINYNQEIPCKKIKREVPTDQCKDQPRVVLSDMLKPKPDPCKPEYNPKPSKTSLCVPLPAAYKTMIDECKPPPPEKVCKPTTEEVKQESPDPRASVDACTKAKEAKMKKDGDKLPCCAKILPKVLADPCEPCDPIVQRLCLKASLRSRYSAAVTQSKLLKTPAKKENKTSKENEQSCNLDVCKDNVKAADPCTKLEDVTCPKVCDKKKDPCAFATFPSATKIDPCFNPCNETSKTPRDECKTLTKIALHKSEPTEDTDSDMCKFSACNDEAPFNLQAELKKKQQYCTKAEPCIAEKLQTCKKKEEPIEIHDESKYDPCDDKLACKIKQALKEADCATRIVKPKECKPKKVDPCKPSGFSCDVKLPEKEVKVDRKPYVCMTIPRDTLQYPCPSATQPEIVDPKLKNEEMIDPKPTLCAPIMENTPTAKIDEPSLNQSAVEDPRQQVAQYAASKAEKLKASLNPPSDIYCLRNKDPCEAERLTKLKLSEEMCKKLKGDAEEKACLLEAGEGGKGSCKFVRRKPCADQEGGCPEGGTGKGSCYKDSCQNIGGIYDRPDCRPAPEHKMPPFKPEMCPETQWIRKQAEAEIVTFPTVPPPEAPDCTPRREVYPPPGMKPPFMNPPRPPTNTSCLKPLKEQLFCREDSAPVKLKCDKFPHCNVIYDATKHQPWCAVPVKGEPQVASGQTCAEYVKRKDQIEGTTTTILPNLEKTPNSPRFDVALPEAKDEDKGIVAGTKGLLQSICSAICPKKKGDGKCEAAGYSRKDANCEGVQPKAGCTLLPECGSEEDTESQKAKSLKQWPFLEQPVNPGPNVLKGCQTKHDTRSYIANKTKSTCRPIPDKMPKDDPGQTRNTPDPNAKWRKC